MMEYKLLGHTGLRVSEYCLGTMTFGTEWGWGADEATSRKLFDQFVEAGGNFIDTANYYTEGSSERYLAPMIKALRSDLVVATKFSLNMDRSGLNNGGNHRKNIRQSVEASLKRLDTDYIDLYWLHAWDFTTGVEEVMRTLDDLVREGKILYTGISDTPAWIVSQANTLAQLKGWEPFCAIQVEYSLVERTTEYDLIPMAEALNLGVLAWSPLAGGLLTGKYSKKEDFGTADNRLKPESWRAGDTQLEIAQLLTDLAQKCDVSPAQLALRWVARQYRVFPIIGARKPEQLADNLAALHTDIDEAVFEELDAISTPPPCFPHRFVAGDNVRTILFGDRKDQLKVR